MVISALYTTENPSPLHHSAVEIRLFAELKFIDLDHSSRSSDIRLGYGVLRYPLVYLVVKPPNCVLCKVSMLSCRSN